MDLDKAIQSVRNVKRFSTEKPDWRDIIECVDASRYSPMAGDNYTLKFIVVNDKDSIQNITDATQQPFISQAGYLVVVCSVPDRVINAYGKEAENYLRQQAGTGIQNFLLKLEEKGLSTCYIRLFVEDQIKRELKIPANVKVEALFPIGYESRVRGEKTREKSEIDIDRILYFNKYGNKKIKPPKKLDV